MKQSNKKESYQTPEIFFTHLASQDVITSSGYDNIGRIPKLWHGEIFNGGTYDEE